LIEDSRPLAAFFHAVLNELKERLSPVDFQNLLGKCDVDSENEDTGADMISTPGQTPAPAD
jgi:hypothetical protein